MTAPRVVLISLAALTGLSSAAPVDHESTIDGTAAGALQRPAIRFNRWQEDWSVLADPALRTEPFDGLKYIALSRDDPRRYLSFGLNLRERYESVSAPSFGIGGGRGDSYLLDRLQAHADLRLGPHWQAFVQLEDVHALGKTIITPADENKLDLRQAFVAYVGGLGEGTVKLRVGRQEMGFDLQRFVAVRDGPNVRQAFDAVWLDYELPAWRFIAFGSQPVQYRSNRDFDDRSNDHLRFGGLRAERKAVGPGDLTVYFARFDHDAARFLDGAGDERRDIVDLRYAGLRGGVDWDLEAMLQGGSVGDGRIRAWAFGSRAGYSRPASAWKPRLGLQVDAASGDRHSGDGVLGTFNPLFPNGFYFTLAGFTGYVNLVHVKPSLTVKPTPKLSLLTALGLQWRATTADAIYQQPNIAVPGTRGVGSRWSGAYAQVRSEWAFSPQLTGAIEAVHYRIGESLRQAGGHDADYFNVELKFGW